MVRLHDININKDITKLLEETFKMQEAYFKNDIAEILVFNATYIGVLIKAITATDPSYRGKYLKRIYEKIEEVVNESSVH